MSAESDKESRTRAIYSLIKSRVIGTQGELVQALTESGYDVTQATVSRDVRRLGLVKVPLAGGGSRYAAPATARPAEPETRSLSSFVTAVENAEAFCVVNTLPGRAMAVAVTIDESGLPGVVGTLAGDDMVLVMIRTVEERTQVRDQLRALFGER